MVSGEVTFVPFPGQCERQPFLALVSLGPSRHLAGAAALPHHGWVPAANRGLGDRQAGVSLRVSVGVEERFLEALHRPHQPLSP